MNSKPSKHLGPPAFVLVAIAGCSQVLGLSDYDVDPSLDAGGASSKAGAAPGGETGEGGSATQGGTGQGGTRPIEGGTGGTGGTLTTGGGSGADTGGAGGEAGGGNIVIIPCASPACCETAGGTPVGFEMLADGGFETGPVASGDSPWTEASTQGEAIITSAPIGPRTGIYYAWCGGLEDEESSVYSEDLIVPDSTGWLELSGYRRFDIDSVDTLNTDFAGIGFYSYEETNPLELPFYWDATSAQGPGQTPDAWVRFSATWNAAPHIGLTRYLMLRGYADAFNDDPTVQVASNYRFDDLSLKAFVCVQ